MMIKPRLRVFFYVFFVFKDNRYRFYQRSYWPVRESHRSLNIALDFYVCRSVRLTQFGMFEYDLQPIFDKFDYDL